MTKFSRYTDKDLIDLGAEAALGALDDGGVTIGDMDVLGCRQPLRGGERRRPAPAEADRPDRHPGVQRGQRVRDRRDRACARVYLADQGGRGRDGPRGRPRADGQGWACSARAARSKATKQGLRAVGSLRLGDARRGRARHRPHARRVRAGRHGVRRTSTTASASSSSPRWPRRTTPTRRSTRWRSTRSSSRSTRSWTPR